MIFLPQIMIYDWILTNKEMLKLIYALIICIICAIIVLKTDRLFKLSNHQGIRYLRNAFFFYGSAFFVRFILGTTNIVGNYSQFYSVSIKILFEFSIVMAGFFLFYSLIWKRIEKRTQYNSLINFRRVVFPEPLSPMKAIFSDLFMSNEMLFMC